MKKDDILAIIWTGVFNTILAAIEMSLTKKDICDAVKEELDKRI